MCGIWAIFGYDKDTMCLLPAFKKIRDRGPDAYRLENILHYANCILGFHRLAIVGSKDGMQPISVKEFPHVWSLTNGEIYNPHLVAEDFGFDYQTTCDVESILHLYYKFGMVDACRHLDGVFACLLMDTIRKRVFIARDTYGVRPVSYLTTPDGLLGVCSEPKGLVPVLQEVGGGHLAPAPPGHVMEFQLADDGKCTLLHVTPFHDVGMVPRYRSLVAADPKLDVYENIRRLLTAAVVKRSHAERRAGALLSGGLDSSLVSALLCKQLAAAGCDYTMQTFAIGLEEDSVDVKAARKVAALLGTEHHEVRFTVEEGVAAVRDVIRVLESYDVTTVRASVGMYLVSRYVSLHTDTKVVFSGEGADELCQGYIYFHKQPSSDAGDQESRRLLKDLHYFDVLRADRTISCWGLEARVPFLDHRFTSYYLSLPNKLKRPINGIEKYTLRKAFSGSGLIPEEILWRPKEAFSDGVSGTKKSWYEVLQEQLESEVTDEELAASEVKYPHNPPRTKEAYFYRRVFEEYYPDQGHLLPYRWMPKWIPGATDPSARTLAHYKSSEKKELKRKDLIENGHL